MYKVKVGKKILSLNEEYAAKNRRFLAGHNKPCLNMISSPGSGKTAILARTITELEGRIRIGVIEGDIQTELDAERIRATGAPAVQINTAGACHLTAVQVAGALKKLPIDELDLIFIENVGNLVCPSTFELGETAKIAVLSVPEGDDKPAKYPAIFARARALLINKMDLLEAVGRVDFNLDRVKTDVLKLHRDIKIFHVSARTGQGFAEWSNWLLELTGK